MPYDWWFDSYRFGNSSPNNFRYNLSSQETKREYDSKIIASLRAGFFTYKFGRTTQHGKNCNCFLCSTVPHILTSNIVLSTIKKYYPEVENLTFSEYFISKYSSGDFLSCHSDKERGIAFVWNLTKNWKPEYGGNLSLIDPLFKGVTTIVPSFNTLTIFNLNEEIEHWVSEVSSAAPSERLAITGWFSKDAL